MTRLSSGNTVFGTTESFKKQTNMAAVKRTKKSGQVLNLAVKSKPKIIEAVAPFVAINSATEASAGEFSYKSDDEYLKIVNTERAAGIVPDEEDSYEILIESVDRPERVISNIYHQPQVIEQIGS